MVTGASEDMDVEVMDVAVVMAVVDEEDVVEGDIVTTHMNSPAGTDH